MPIQGFDYKAFAMDLAKQAMEILMQPGSNAAPSSLTDQDKKIIIETVRKFCLMSGEALSNDQQLKLTAEQASIITQFIGEWTFHKSIDLIKGKIPPPNREAVLQVIAANIFNTAKLAIIKKLPQDNLITLIEEKVKQVYQDELQKLVKKGQLSPKQYEMAVNTCNLNDMVQKTETQAAAAAENVNQQAVTPPNDKKVLKFAALAIILKKLPEQKANEILNNLNKSDVQHILNYMRMSDIEEKIDHQVIIKTLEEIKSLIPSEDVLNIPKVLKSYRKFIQSTSPEILSTISIKEREAVKDFILDLSFPAANTFSPYVIQSLIKTIEEKINDY